MTDLAQRLTITEASLFAECEQIIERGMGVFIETGVALMSVRDGRLYRETHGTFEDYCSARWGLERAHAYRLMDSARVVEILSPIGDEIFPATESQARELAPLLDQPDELREVWQRTVERTEGKPTATAIRETWREREEPAPAPDVRPSAPSSAEDTVDEGNARRDEELDARMEGTEIRFRRNFSTAVRRAAEIWSFDPERIAEVYVADFEREIARPFLQEMNAFCERVAQAHRDRRAAGLRVVNGGWP